VIDLGTGDGRAVMTRARCDPDALVIGIDAAATAMTESSLRAARPDRRGGLPNALFLVAAAECPPPELLGLADEVSILFPWGSLLRGVLAIDDVAAAGIAGLLRPGGRVEAFVSITERDALGMPPLRAADAELLATRWARHGLDLVAFEPATSAEIDATGSTWARRLRAGRDRPVWCLSLGCGRRVAMGD
jgi:16S rRNA (adenine(1408)-N(1))-methyltransferase